MTLPAASALGRPAGRRAYLDYNATAPLRPAARGAMLDALAVPGNPSSVHAEGRRAHATLERARAAIAALVGVAPDAIVFTSGATEANAIMLAGIGGQKLVGATEHASVIEACPDAVSIPVDHRGLIRLGALEDLLGKYRPALVAVMAANNETGVLQPLADIATLCGAVDCHLHVDAVQILGRLPFDFGASGAHSLALSAHKLGGPAGIGALVVADRVDIPPLWRGGGQERRRRAGTENLAGIAGFAAAAGERTDWSRLAALRERLERAVKVIAPDAIVAGEDAPRLPNTTCLVTPGVKAELQVMALDLDGVAVSAGAACSSGKVKRSHVLDAMGFEHELAASAIRVSLGWATEEAEVDLFLEAYARMVQRVRARQLTRRVA